MDEMLTDIDREYEVGSGEQCHRRSCRISTGSLPP
jgi:hypothetical protein